VQRVEAGGERKSDDPLLEACKTLVGGLKQLSTSSPSIPFLKSIPGCQDATSGGGTDSNDQITIVRKQLLARQEVRVSSEH
jgi:hypothetical protein